MGRGIGELRLTRVQQRALRLWFEPARDLGNKLLKQSLRVETAARRRESAGPVRFTQCGGFVDEANVPGLPGMFSAILATVQFHCGIDDH